VVIFKIWHRTRVGVIFDIKKPLEVTLEGGTLNVGITVEAALEVASRVQTWFWGAQDSIDLAVM
jgi:hypothetical protein